jgi:hypothetical protein
MRHGHLFAAILATSVATTRLAAAADPSPQDIAQARELGGQAQAAFEAGSYAESEKLWVAASNLYPQAPTLTLGLARTQAKLGKLVLAQESYNKIIREQGEIPNLKPAFKDALEAAKAEVPAISAKIASVVIVVEGAPTPTVTLDGQPVSNAGLGLKRPVDPGSHVVKAEAAGFKPAETSFQVAESGAAEAKLKLVKVENVATAAAAAPPSDGARPVEISAGKKPDRTLAYVALGVGGAGLVLGSVTGIVALGKHGELADKCPDSKCPNAVSGDIDSYKTMGALSTVGFVVGAVGVAAGAVLWFTAPKETAAAPGVARAAARAVSWHPYIGVGGGGVTGRF